jgi:fatty-acyl-CoA synthase
MPDSKWGERPCAFIEVTQCQSVTKQALHNWCREQLAAYKAPEHFKYASTPRTSTGKIQKYILRETANAIANK